MPKLEVQAAAVAGPDGPQPPAGPGQPNVSAATHQAAKLAHRAEVNLPPLALSYLGFPAEESFGENRLIR